MLPTVVARRMEPRHAILGGYGSRRRSNRRDPRECEECKRRNYQSEKSKRNNPDRIELRKYCRWCGKHTPHKETR